MENDIVDSSNMISLADRSSGSDHGSSDGSQSDTLFTSPPSSLETQLPHEDTYSFYEDENEEDYAQTCWNGQMCLAFFIIMGIIWVILDLLSPRTK